MDEASGLGVVNSEQVDLIVHCQGKVYGGVFARCADEWGPRWRW